MARRFFAPALLLLAALALALPSYAQFAEQRVWGGTTGGSANSQTVTISNYASLQVGVPIRVIWGFTNTSSLAVNISGTGATTVRKPTATGLTVLTGGEAVTGNVGEFVYDGTQLVLLTDNNTRGPQASIASSATTDLGTITSHNALITGTTTITAFGSSASANDPLYWVTFSGALTLTHNATSLIMPGAENRTTVAGDSAIVEYLGSGNWRVRQFTAASQNPVVTPLCGASSLVITNNSGTPNTIIDVTASQVVMTTAAGYSKTRSSVSVSINTGNANVINGIDAARASDTWYNIYLLDNGTTTGGYASTNAVGSFGTTPSGYTFFCRLGAMRTDGSGNFYRTRQLGRDSQYIVGTNPAVARVIASGAAGTYSTTTPVLANAAIGTFAPPTATAIQILITNHTNAGGPAGVLVAPNDAWDGTNTGPLGSAGQTWPAWLDSATNYSFPIWILLESTNIAWASSGAGGVLAAYGWRDSVNAN